MRGDEAACCGGLGPAFGIQGVQRECLTLHSALAALASLPQFMRERLLIETQNELRWATLLAERRLAGRGNHMQPCAASGCPGLTGPRLERLHWRLLASGLQVHRGAVPGPAARGDGGPGAAHPPPHHHDGCARRRASGPAPRALQHSGRRPPLQTRSSSLLSSPTCTRHQPCVLVPSCAADACCCLCRRVGRRPVRVRGGDYLHALHAGAGVCSAHLPPSVGWEIVASRGSKRGAVLTVRADQWHAPRDPPAALWLAVPGLCGGGAARGAQGALLPAAGQPTGEGARSAAHKGPAAASHDPCGPFAA